MLKLVHDTTAEVVGETGLSTSMSCAAWQPRRCWPWVMGRSGSGGAERRSPPDP
jgi:hypothetical protein